ncbi:MAG: ROK family protein [Herpetosiphonaceae bacterium]|nr:ROK family protein [Herpetosiphonaceae bacterium]
MSRCLAVRTVDDVITAALGGDTNAYALLNETGRYLGAAIAHVANLLNPEIVVVGGTIMRAGNLVLDGVSGEVRQRLHPRMVDQLQIVDGALGPDAGAIGAAALVIRDFLSQCS